MAAADAQIAFPQIQRISPAPWASRSPGGHAQALWDHRAHDDRRRSFDLSRQEQHQRVRPFVVHGDNTCYAKDEALSSARMAPTHRVIAPWMRGAGAGRVEPHQADALVQRGREFGQSRLICDAHWQSDIDAGRVVAAPLVARLHADLGLSAPTLTPPGRKPGAARQTPPGLSPAAPPRLRAAVIVADRARSAASPARGSRGDPQAAGAVGNAPALALSARISRKRWYRPSRIERRPPEPTGAQPN